jgi:hypothetical protein
MNTLNYLECDLPDGVTLRQWRHARCARAGGGRGPWAALRRIVWSHR